MIGKIVCKECKCKILITVPERLDKFGEKIFDMRGVKTRKYCSECGSDRKKSYKHRRLHRRQNTQTEKIENKLNEYIISPDSINFTLESYKTNMVNYRKKIKQVYNKISSELGIPTDTIRRVLHDMRKNGTFK